MQGDNLHTLKALLPRYAGQVKCIYIDPPHNAGNECWVYNDHVNSLEIRRWLGEVVGKEGETLDHHDRWLCIMYPRLVPLRQFVRVDGAIFIFIDDNSRTDLAFDMLARLRPSGAIELNVTPEEKRWDWIEERLH